MTPPTLIGFNFATGVIVPVLPTWKSTSIIFDSTSMEENLWAIAHLGAFEMKPSSFWCEMLLTL